MEIRNKMTKKLNIYEGTNRSGSTRATMLFYSRATGSMSSMTVGI